MSWLSGSRNELVKIQWHELLHNTTWSSIFDNLNYCMPQYELVYLMIWVSACHYMIWEIRKHGLVRTTTRINVPQHKLVYTMVWVSVYHGTSYHTTAWINILVLVGCCGMYLSSSYVGSRNSERCGFNTSWGWQSLINWCVDCVITSNSAQKWGTWINTET